MENGNGNSVESSGLSKHVRPLLAIFGFIVYALTLFVVLPAALADKEWGIVGVLLLPLLAFGLWYIGIRGQDKMMERFGNMQATAVNAVKEALLPKVGNGYSDYEKDYGDYGDSFGTIPIEPQKPEEVKPKPEPQLPSEIFTKEDDEAGLSQLARNEIAKWYTKVLSKPPTIPSIPWEDVSYLGYNAVESQTAARYAEAANEIAEESYKVFPESERSAVVESLKGCNAKTWHCVNQHWAKARKVWIDYGMSLWKWKNGYA